MRYQSLRYTVVLFHKNVLYIRKIYYRKRYQKQEKDVSEVLKSLINHLKSSEVFLFLFHFRLPSLLAFFIIFIPYFTPFVPFIASFLIFVTCNGFVRLFNFCMSVLLFAWFNILTASV